MDEFKFCPSCGNRLELVDIEETGADDRVWDGESAVWYVFDCPSCGKTFRYELPSKEE